MKRKRNRTPGLLLFAALVFLYPPASAKKLVPGNDHLRARAHTPASVPQQAAPDLVEFDSRLARVAEKLRDMQQQLEAIRHAADNQERLRILEQHWNTLQAAMESLQELWGPGMMGCCGNAPPAEEKTNERKVNGPMTGGTMDWRSASSYYSSLTLEQMRQRQYQTDQYLAMQQQIMHQLMLHQHWVYQIQTQSPARTR